MLALATMTPFAEWLDGELKARGMNRRQLAAYMNRPDQTVYSWFNDDRIPRTEFCLDIARVLHLPEDDVLRRAGHLGPATTEAPNEEVPAWLADLILQLDDFEKRAVGDTAQALLRLREARAAYPSEVPPRPASGRARRRPPQVDPEG